MSAYQPVVPLANQLFGIQHVGIVVENMAKSLEFYTEVLGGKLVLEVKGVEGKAIHYTLMQKEELEAFSMRKDPLELYIPDLQSGKQQLDICLIQFDNLFIELLQYRDAMAAPFESFPFEAKHTFSSPAFINSMHICFLLKEDILVDEFVVLLEAECRRRDMPQVRCNRTIPIQSEAERQKAPLESNSCKLSGNFEGMTIVYCKGPSGEQLEFSQLKGKAKGLLNPLQHEEMI